MEPREIENINSEESSNDDNSDLDSDDYELKDEEGEDIELDIEDLIKRTDLEEETVQEVVKILKAEFED